MPRITISYRREDSIDITGRIFDRLAGHYGRQSIFRDIDNIVPGFDFREHIDKALRETDILIVVVGPRWFGPSEQANRIHDEADPVRIEVETALRRRIPVIPILVGNSPMPRTSQLPETLRDFAFRHAVQVDSGRDFDHHVAGLLRAMDGILSARQEPAPPAPAPVPAAAPAPAPTPAPAPNRSATSMQGAAVNPTPLPDPGSRLAQRLGSPSVRLIATYVAGALIIAQAAVRGAWAASSLIQQSTAYFQDTLSVIESSLFVLGAIPVTIGIIFRKAWGRFSGIAFCIAAIAFEIYWIVRLSAVEPNTSVIYLGTLVPALIILCLLWPRMKEKATR